MGFTLSCILFLALVLVSVNFGYVLKVVPDTVDVGLTKDVQLECDHMGGTGFLLSSISRIRIDKLINGTWTLMSEMLDLNSLINNHNPNVTVTGAVDSPSATYLRVTWGVATADAPGTYRCQIIGLDDAGDIAVQKTDSVTIRVNAAVNASDPSVIQFLLQQNTDLQHQIHSLQDHTAHELSDILNLIRENQIAELQLFNNIHNQLSDIAQKQTELDYRLTALEGGVVLHTTNAPFPMDTTTQFQVDNSLHWPGGKYGLFEPRTGCPVSNVFNTWTSGVRRHRTDPQFSHDFVSLNNHMMEPTVENINGSQFVYQRFCMVERTTLGGAWPRGSYCINREGGTCPRDFFSGYISMDDISTAEDVFGALPDGLYNSATTMYYCCRDDDLQDNPIQLPTAVPFYLYRYGGACQEVAGMRHQEEFIVIDTNNRNNQDMYENNWHPDGNIDDVRIQLCYYESV